MGRSVYVSPDAETAVFFTIDWDDDGPEYPDEYRVDDLECAVLDAFPSLVRARPRSFRLPEGRAIGYNAHADLVLTEYAGVWALALIPNGDPVSGLARHWCRQVEALLERAVAAGGGTVLRLLGRASNGEAFYRRA